MNIKKFKVKYVSAEMITPHIKEIKFERLDKQIFIFVPGQFITFLFKNKRKETKLKSYSLTKIQINCNKIVIAISCIPNGLASELFFYARKNNVFNVLGPVGKLKINLCGEIKKLFFIGSGTGVGPYRSMLTQLRSLIARYVINVYIIISTRYRKDIIYHKEFIKYAKYYKNIHLNIYLTNKYNKLKRNEYNAHIQNKFKNFSMMPLNDIVFLCGNQYMVNNIYKKLIDAGFKNHSILKEKYISQR